MPENAMEMRNISKSFPGVKVLDNVNFDVRHSEIHGLIGENGAGKSTLMNILMGIHKAESGDIQLNGRSAQITSPYHAIRLGIGMVPQELNLNPYVSAAENVFLGNLITTRTGTIDWSKINEAAKKMLHTIGVDINPRIIVNKLSVAEQQLIQIARVLSAGAHILVFDEPTAALTASETEFLLNVMKQLREQNKSVIFITHHLEELISTTDRITIMRDGKIVSVNNTSDITIDKMIEDMAGQEILKKKHVESNISDEVMLKIENFSRENEFKDVSFEVHRGEIFGIGGLVGAGRTELANAIFGITQKDKGKLFFEGKEVKIKSPPEAIKLGIGYLPEERRSHGIFPVLSLCENLSIVIYDRLFKGFKLQYGKAREISEDFISKMKIKTPHYNTPIKNLSGGNQQKVILSRWLSRNSKLLILDEPTRGIDVNAKGEIYDLIRDLANQGMTVIVISSEHEELILLTHRVMIMHEGKVKDIVKSSELTQQDILEVALKKGAGTE